MRSYILFCFMILFFSISCKEKEKQLVCSEEFRFVIVQFKNQAGELIDVLEYSSINTRTNKILSSGKQNGQTPLGHYLVTDDNNRKEFSKSGDIVLVSAKHPVTGVVKTAEFKIAADECHINKISGPTVIVFD